MNEAKSQKVRLRKALTPVKGGVHFILPSFLQMIKGSTCISGLLLLFPGMANQLKGSARVRMKGWFPWDVRTRVGWFKWFVLIVFLIVMPVLMIWQLDVLMEAEDYAHTATLFHAASSKHLKHRS